MQFNFKYDTGRQGLLALLKDYEGGSLKVMWENPGKQFLSREVLEAVNVRLGDKKTISRASIINFLEKMRKTGILKGEERPGRGGHHWIYSPAMSDAEFKQYIARTILENLMRDFPEETAEAVKKIKPVFS